MNVAIFALMTVALAPILHAQKAVPGTYAYLFAGGSGTASDPYRLSTPQHLSNLRRITEIIASTVDPQNYEDYASYHFYYKMTGDIDISSFSREKWGDRGWNPIPSFGGHLDGDGHKVTGLWIDEKNTAIPGAEHVGLFRDLGGTTEHLGVVTDEAMGGVKGTLLVGGIAGTLSGVLSDCYVAGHVGGYGGINNHVGGLAGRMAMGSRITNCYATGRITVLPYSGGHVGGLAGEMMSYRSTDEEETIALRPYLANSYSACDITVAARAGKAGGLVGDLGLGEVSNCYATGNLIASGGEMNDPQTIGSTLGGLIGKVSGTAQISNCYMAGQIGDGTEEWSGPVIGALPGGSSGWLDYDGNRVVHAAGITIANCYFLQEPNGINSHIDPSATEGYGTPSPHYPGLVPYAEGVGIGKTEAEMKVQDSFDGFDFDGVWRIDEGSGFPYLRGIAENATHPRSDGVPAAGELSAQSGTALNVYAVDGILHIDGLVAGEAFSIYGIGGQLIYSSVATADEQIVPLTGKGVYIIAAGNKRVKVIQ